MYNNILIYYLILYKTLIMSWYNKLRKKWIDIKKIVMITKNEITPKNIIGRYLLFKFLTYIITSLTNIRNNLDIKADKIEIIKDSDDGYKTIIIDSKMISDSKEYITILDVVNYIEKGDKQEYQSSNLVKNKVFIKFELHSETESTPICLKKYLTKYRDMYESNHHTLDNIIHFNCHEISRPNDDSKVKITYISQGKLVTYELLYKEVCDKHINYFHKLN